MNHVVNLSSNSNAVYFHSAVSLQSISTPAGSGRFSFKTPWSGSYCQLHVKESPRRGLAPSPQQVSDRAGTQVQVFCFQTAFLALHPGCATPNLVRVTDKDATSKGSSGLHAVGWRSRWHMETCFSAAVGHQLLSAYSVFLALSWQPSCRISFALSTSTPQHTHTNTPPPPPRAFPDLAGGNTSI